MTNFADRTIWTGDNLDILRGLNSASVDLIYLDPPFNSCMMAVRLLEMRRVLKDTGSIHLLESRVAGGDAILVNEPHRQPVVRCHWRDS